MKTADFRGFWADFAEFWVVNHIYSNLYHYAANNPIKYTDPDGRQVAQAIPLPEVILELAQVGQELKNMAPQLAIAGGIILGVY